MLAFMTMILTLQVVRGYQEEIINHTTSQESYIHAHISVSPTKTADCHEPPTICTSTSVLPSGINPSSPISPLDLRISPTDTSQYQTSVLGETSIVQLTSITRMPTDFTDTTNSFDADRNSSRTISATVLMVSLIAGISSLVIAVSTVTLIVLGYYRYKKSMKLKMKQQKRKRKPVGLDLVVNEATVPQEDPVVSQEAVDSAPSYYFHTLDSLATKKSNVEVKRKRRRSTIPRGFKLEARDGVAPTSQVEIYQLSHCVQDRDFEDTASDDNDNEEVSSSRLRENKDEASSRKKILTKQLSTDEIGYEELCEHYYTTLDKVRNGVRTEEVPFHEPAASEKAIVAQINRNMSRDIPPKYLKITGIDSRGYGVGTWKNQVGTLVDVGVKTMLDEDHHHPERRLKLLQEAAVMGQFSHPNVIKLLGVTLTKQNVTLVMESTSKGNLKSVLLAMRSKGLSRLPPGRGEVLLGYSQQICFGMDYLSSKGYVHGHLQARNILLTTNQVLKITHFEACDQRADYQLSDSEQEAAMKWEAPEVALDLYSNSSDVWSYGCVLFEIWSIGKTPFSEHPEQQVLEMLKSGYRLPPPHACPNLIYDWMVKCWHFDAGSRPQFSEMIMALMKKDNALLVNFEATIHVHEDTNDIPKDSQVTSN